MHRREFPVIRRRRNLYLTSHLGYKRCDTQRQAWPISLLSVRSLQRRCAHRRRALDQQKVKLRGTSSKENEWQVGSRVWAVLDRAGVGRVTFSYWRYTGWLACGVAEGSNEIMIKRHTLIDSCHVEKNMMKSGKYPRILMVKLRTAVGFVWLNMYLWRNSSTEYAS